MTKFYLVHPRQLKGKQFQFLKSFLNGEPVLTVELPEAKSFDNLGQLNAYCKDFPQLGAYKPAVVQWIDASENSRPAPVASDESAPVNDVVTIPFAEHLLATISLKRELMAALEQITLLKALNEGLENDLTTRDRQIVSLKNLVLVQANTITEL